MGCVIIRGAWGFTAGFGFGAWKEVRWWMMGWNKGNGGEPKDGAFGKRGRGGKGAEQE